MVRRVEVSILRCVFREEVGREVRREVNDILCSTRTTRSVL